MDKISLFFMRLTKDVSRKEYYLSHIGNFKNKYSYEYYN